MSIEGINDGLRDNTATMCREFYDNGKLLWKVSAEKLATDPNLKERPPFGHYPDVAGQQAITLATVRELIAIIHDNKKQLADRLQLVSARLHAALPPDERMKEDA